jgi:hypothetical protein
MYTKTLEISETIKGTKGNNTRKTCFLGLTELKKIPKKV